MLKVDTMISNGQHSIPHYEECHHYKLVSTSRAKHIESGHPTPGKWNPNCSCLFSSLPQGVLVHIHSWLPLQEVITSCAQVCTRWKAASSSPILYKSVIFPELLYRQDLSLLHKILRSHGDVIEVLHIYKGRAVTDETLHLMSQYSRNIRSLTLTHLSLTSSHALDRLLASLLLLRDINMLGSSSLTNTSLMILSKYNIRQLIVSYTPLTNVGLVNAWVSNDKSRSIEVIDIRGCMYVKKEAIISMLRCCPNLKVLKLNGSGVIFSDSVAKTIAIHNTEVEVILADAMDTFSGNQALTDAGLTSMLRACRSMNHMSISGAVMITDRSVREISTLPCLSFLDISYCSGITEAGRDDVRGISSLKEINL